MTDHISEETRRIGGGIRAEQAARKTHASAACITFATASLPACRHRSRAREHRGAGRPVQLVELGEARCPRGATSRPSRAEHPPPCLLTAVWRRRSQRSRESERRGIKPVFVEEHTPITLRTLRKGVKPTVRAILTDVSVVCSTIYPQSLETPTCGLQGYTEWTATLQSEGLREGAGEESDDVR